MKWAAIALALVACSAQAQQPFDWNNIVPPPVGYLSGEDLYKRSRDLTSAGYIMGVYDANLMSRQGGLYCVPDAVKSGQLLDVAWRFLEQNPQLRHLSAAHLVRQSFSAGFPCGK